MSSSSSDHDQQVREAMWTLECWESEHDALLEESKRADAHRGFLASQIHRAERGMAVTRAKLNDLGVKL